MKKTYSALIISGLLLALAGCSSSPTEEEGQNTDSISPPSGEAATDAVPPPDGLTAPSADASAPPPASPDAALTDAATPPPMDATMAPPPAADPALAAVPPTPDPVAAPSADAVAPSPAGSGNLENYTVQAGDTLMKIAFETYGDLYRWHAILEANRDKISDPNRIPAGTVLKVERPATPVSIERNGERYTIKSGDTLGSIANQVYGTRSRWKEIWENNKQLIKNPNKIFAGFALYYMNGTQAPVASDVPAAKPAETSPDPMAQNGAVTGRAPASNTASMSVSAPAAPPSGTTATGDAPVIENAPAAAGQ